VKNLLQNIRVLLAEDNEVNKLLAKSILLHWGIHAKVAQTGQEVINMVREEDFDVILMDIQMPEKSGIEATQEIRAFDDEKKKNIPIIALTANALKGEEQKYLAVGMNEYLTKPFTAKELQDVITRVINNTGSFGSRYVSDEIAEINDSEKLYKLDLLQEMSHGNHEFVVKLARIFIETVPVTAQELIAACEQQRWEDASKLAHKLKATIDTMQIVAIKQDIRVIEREGKDITAEPQENLLALAHKVSKVIDATVRQLREEFNL